jgi:hypothetical protein
VRGDEELGKGVITTCKYIASVEIFVEALNNLREVGAGVARVGAEFYS